MNWTMNFSKNSGLEVINIGASKGDRCVYIGCDNQGISGCWSELDVVAVGA